MDTATPTETDKTIPSPGEDIKPKIHQKEISRLLSDVFGFRLHEYRELVSYDDRNFHVIVDGRSGNPHVPEVSQHGYVLKILNTLISRQPNALEGQTALFEYLKQKGQLVPECVPNIQGQLFCLQDVAADERCETKNRYAIRMLTYIPGETFNNKTTTLTTARNFGRFTGRLTTEIKDFRHAYYENLTHLWCLQELPRIKEFVYVLQDDKDKNMILEIIQEFTDTVINHLDRLQRGFIHGDMNEQNILVSEVSQKEGTPDKSRDYEIVGLLDLADATLSYSVFEPAIFVAYLLLWSESDDYITIVCEFFREVIDSFPFNDFELSIIYICVAARLTQSVVLGAYTNYMDPSNTYVLTTQKQGWLVLRRWWSLDKEMVQNRLLDLKRQFIS